MSTSRQRQVLVAALTCGAVGATGGRAPRRGFTLVELLISILLTSIVITGTYIMFTSSSEVFHHQELTSENHNNIRFAVELLKADIARAGYHSSPNAMDDPVVCPKPTFAVPAIQIIEGQTTTVPGVIFDELVVLGDMTSQPPFGVAAISSNSIMLQPDVVLTPEEFTATFPTGRVIRISNAEGMSQFAKVQSSEPSTLSITLATSLTAASGEGGCGYVPTAPEAHEVNPVVAYLYTIEPDDNEAEKTDLVRWQVEFRANAFAPVPGTRLVVAEYVVGLDFLALGVAGTSAPNQPDVEIEPVADLLSLNTSSAGGASVLTDVNTRPEGVRFVVFRLETRTRRAVPRRLAVPSSAIQQTAAERGYFEMSGDRVAEVRTIQGKVAIPNLTLRNLR